VLFGAASLAAIGMLWRASQPATAAAAHKAQGLLEGTPPDFGSIDKFGQILFSADLFPFELSSALLMVAIVGAVAVARGRGKHDAEIAREETPVSAAPARPLDKEAVS
jgi:NADH-quinone oxidoreductase subunit J